MLISPRDVALLVVRDQVRVPHPCGDTTSPQGAGRVLVTFIAPVRPHHLDAGRLVVDRHPALFLELRPHSAEDSVLVHLPRPVVAQPVDAVVVVVVAGIVRAHQQGVAVSLLVPDPLDPALAPVQIQEHRHRHPVIMGEGEAQAPRDVDAVLHAHGPLLHVDEVPLIPIIATIDRQKSRKGDLVLLLIAAKARLLPLVQLGSGRTTRWMSIANRRAVGVN